MQQITQSQYRALHGETGEIVIARRRVSHLPSVVHKDEVLQPNADKQTLTYRFRIKAGGGSLDRLIVTCTFMAADKNSAEYSISVRDDSGNSWQDRVIKKTHPPLTWMVSLRFVVQ